MRQLLKLSIVLFCFCLNGKETAAQIDTVSSVVKVHSPKRAAIYSAILPGAGQIYNKKYWKVPIVWGALGFCFWQTDTLTKSYRTFKDMSNAKRTYIANLPDNPSLIDPYPALTLDYLTDSRDLRRRNRDLLVIISAGLWVLNVVDASVDGHLFNYDISDDLSLDVQPNFYLDERNNQLGVNAFSLTYKF